MAIAFGQDFDTHPQLIHSMDTEPQVMTNHSMVWTTAEPDSVSLSEATRFMPMDSSSTKTPLFDELHLGGSIACGVSLVGSLGTIAYFFTNEEKSFYKRKVNQKQ